eukprot:12589569-Ditylum_brightwellii.AAC.1
MMYYSSRHIFAFLLLALLSTSQVKVANGDCESDSASLAQDFDYIKLIAEIATARLEQCSQDILEGKECTPDFSDAQKICEDDLDADWFYYSVTIDCGQGAVE